MMCINCHCFILSVYHQTDCNVLFLWFPLGSSCLRPLLQAASFPWFCMESWCKTASARSKSSRLRSLVRRQATFQIESIHLFLPDVLTITGGANPGTTWPSCVFGLAPSASLQYLGHLDAQAFTYIYIDKIYIWATTYNDSEINLSFPPHSGLPNVNSSDLSRKAAKPKIPFLRLQGKVFRFHWLGHF